MGRFLFWVVVGAAAYLLIDRDRRERAVELAKDASDVLVSGVLRVTSEFGSELTVDGWEEQRLFRLQRLRDLRRPRRSVQA
jgi:hypothetical protein